MSVDILHPLSGDHVLPTFESLVAYDFTPFKVKDVVTVRALLGGQSHDLTVDLNSEPETGELLFHFTNVSEGENHELVVKTDPEFGGDTEKPIVVRMTPMITVTTVTGPSGTTFTVAGNHNSTTSGERIHLVSRGLVPGFRSRSAGGGSGLGCLFGWLAALFGGRAASKWVTLDEPTSKAAFGRVWTDSANAPGEHEYLNFRAQLKNGSSVTGQASLSIER